MNASTTFCPKYFDIVNGAPFWSISDVCGTLSPTLRIGAVRIGETGVTMGADERTRTPRSVAGWVASSADATSRSPTRKATKVAGAMRYVIVIAGIAAVAVWRTTARPLLASIANTVPRIGATLAQATPHRPRSALKTTEESTMRFRRIDPRMRQLARRDWTQSERRNVWRGLTGRSAIAIEPLLGLIFFSLLT